MNNWGITSIKHHESFKQSMVSHKGEILRTSQIKQIVQRDSKISEHDAQFAAV
jgi:hypothetical protein